MATKKAASRDATNGNDHEASGSTRDAEKPWDLRLYIAGDSPRSQAALRNVRKLCDERLKQPVRIEVIDLTKHPELAKKDQIIAVPTLVRKLPEPIKRIIGNLSDADRALILLEMND